MTIIQKFQTDEPEKGFPKKYIGLIIISLFMLVLIEIWVSNSAVIYGEKLERLSKLAKTLNVENQILENEIAKGESLNVMASKSAEFGFFQPESIQYIR